MRNYQTRNPLHYLYKGHASAHLSTLFIGWLIGLLFISAASSAMADINIYSARKENLIKPLLDRFTKQTGIKTNLLTAKADALLERIKSEGKNTPADILITVDAARLQRAKELNLLQNIASKKLSKIIPAAYRDKDSKWFGLSLRSRVILITKKRIKPAEISDYESLALPKWKDRICVRSSNNVYNQSWVASMLHAHGEQKTLQWIKDLVANFARSPTGGDRDQILLAASGVCDIAIVNTYYFGMMLDGNDIIRKQAAEKMQLVWPNQDGRGTHINISGAGILRTSKNKQEAQKLLEYLVSKDAQMRYSQDNHEYPVRSDVSISDTLKAWGPFKADAIPLSKVGELNAEAVKLMDKGGWL